MMEHYVTLFDSLFLPQALALHASLQRHAGAYTLWVLCMDDATSVALRGLRLDNVRPVPLSEVETPELLTAKRARTRGEYCWTLTPFTPRMVFDREPSARRVTYVDADVWLRRPPGPIFEALERSGKAVLITEHAYAVDRDQTETSGRFCVQFVTFERERGEVVRRWWAERCIEWCFARLEDGKFGDQKYLDDWPERFGPWVHVLERPEWMQGPWNTARFASREALAFHFHGLRLLRNRNVLLSDVYPIPPQARSELYDPYLADLHAGLQRLESALVEVRPQIDRPVWLQRLKLLGQQGLRELRRLHQKRTQRVVRLA